MNAQAITARIIDDARADAARTLREAREKASLIRQQSDEELEKKRAEAQLQAEAQSRELRDRMLRMAELDQKKQMLSVKREVVDQVFERALARIQRMPVEKKRAFIERLVLTASEDGEEMIVSTEDRALFDGAFLGRLNAALASAGKKPITLSQETRPLEGGFVLKHGGMEINCTFRALLDQAQPALEAEIAGRLFAQG